jgi:hypothetical protein
MDDKTKSPLELLMQHPVAPVVGGFLVASAYLTDEPAPPPVSDALPETTQKQWQMIYTQNQQRFQRRMDLLKDLGMVLLGFASAQTILGTLQQQPNAPLPSLPVLPVLTADDARKQRGAM